MRSYSVKNISDLLGTYAFLATFSNTVSRERSGSVVECLTRDQSAAGSSLTGVTALWSLSKTFILA